RPRPLWSPLAARRIRHHGLRQRSAGIQDQAADRAQNVAHAGEVHPLRTEGAPRSSFEPWALGLDFVHMSVLECSTPRTETNRSYNPSIKRTISNVIST